MPLDVLNKERKLYLWSVEVNPVVEDDSEDEFKDGSEGEFEDGSEADEEEAYEEVNHHPIVDFDKEDPPMKVQVGSLSTCNQT